MKRGSLISAAVRSETGTDFDRSPAAKERLPIPVMKCRPASAERDTARHRTVSAAFVSERVTVNVLPLPSMVKVDACAEKVAPIATVASSAASVLRKAKVFITAPFADCRTEVSLSSFGGIFTLAPSRVAPLVLTGEAAIWTAIGPIRA